MPIHGDEGSKRVKYHIMMIPGLQYAGTFTNLRSDRLPPPEPGHDPDAGLHVAPSTDVGRHLQRLHPPPVRGPHVEGPRQAGVVLGKLFHVGVDGLGVRTYMTSSMTKGHPKKLTMEGRLHAFQTAIFVQSVARFHRGSFVNFIWLFGPYSSFLLPEQALADRHKKFRDRLDENSCTVN